MFERKIQFYCTDDEIEKAIPKLIRNKIDFTIRHLDSQKKECWSVSVAFLIKDSVARILYGN